jgi:hypothetical protein
VEVAECVGGRELSWPEIGEIDPAASSAAGSEPNAS